MIHVGHGRLSLNDFSELIFKQKEIALDEKALQDVKNSFNFLQKFSANKLIYGINTGFGPMAQYKVSEENLLQLQYNLIRSHSSGSGRLMDAALFKGNDDKPLKYLYAGLFGCTSGCG
jgi:histidine ammonia-lyase